MTGNYLLDSNAWIRLFHNDAEVRRRVSEAETIHLCSHVFGELYFGAINSKAGEQKVREVEELLQGANFLICDTQTAREFAKLKLYLRAKGTPIPVNDCWIAATAIQHKLTLVSQDSHFDAIPHLPKDRW